MASTWIWGIGSDYDSVSGEWEEAVYGSIRLQETLFVWTAWRLCSWVEYRDYSGSISVLHSGDDETQDDWVLEPRPVQIQRPEISGRQVLSRALDHSKQRNKLPIFRKTGYDQNRSRSHSRLGKIQKSLESSRSWLYILLDSATEPPITLSRKPLRARPKNLHRETRCPTETRARSRLTARIA